MPASSDAWEFEAIGTKWQIEIGEPSERRSAYEELDLAKRHRLCADSEALLLSRINERIEEFGKAYSRFRLDSLVTQMAQRAGTYVLPEDAKPMMDLYRKLYDITDGAFTPLIGQVLSDAGYDADYSLQPKELVTPPSWDDVLDYNFPELALKRPALLDFGAAGKGYLVDIIAKLIEEAGYDTYSIDAGGDIRVRTPTDAPSRIGLEHPDDPTQVIGVAEISQGSICGSAGNRRVWAGFHHVISPHTLTSPQEIKAVWVVADTALVADALTTCLFFLKPDELVERLVSASTQDSGTAGPDLSFEYLVLKADFSFEKSSNFPGEIFIATEAA